MYLTSRPDTSSANMFVVVNSLWITLCLASISRSCDLSGFMINYLGILTSCRIKTNRLSDRKMLSFYGAKMTCFTPKFINDLLLNDPTLLNMKKNVAAVFDVITVRWRKECYYCRASLCIHFEYKDSQS